MNDMQQTVRRFHIITLRPHWGQYIISQGFMFLVSLVLFLVAGHEALQFIVSSEQLIIQHGIFHRTSDYIELYRIVDFCEQRCIMEQLFGLKTISIYSGDRTNPKLDIYGVREKLDVVGIIRERVEYNKQRRGVYEITNR